jgi:SAM-dependent methyltransferase
MILTLFVITLVACASGVVPPRDPPVELVSEFTQGGKIPIAKMYIDDNNQGKGTHYSYPRKAIESHIVGAQRQASMLRRYIEKEEEDDDDDYNVFDIIPKKNWIPFALLLHEDKLKGKNVAVFGSIDPYIESIVIAYGANQVTTFEYNKFTLDHNKINVVCGDEYRNLIASHSSCSSSIESGSNSKEGACDSGSSEYDGSFDVVLSFSSFDHSGLGRYGDEIDPNGDIKAMKFAHSVLKNNGYMFLTIPIGPDVIVWNLHRRYGMHRLPLMLENFTVIDRLGWKEELLEKEANWRQTYEPIFVLTKIK